MLREVHPDINCDLMIVSCFRGRRSATRRLVQPTINSLLMVDTALSGVKSTSINSGQLARNDSPIVVVLWRGCRSTDVRVGKLLIVNPSMGVGGTTRAFNIVHTEACGILAAPPERSNVKLIQR